MLFDVQPQPHQTNVPSDDNMLLMWRYNRSKNKSRKAGGGGGGVVDDKVKPASRRRPPTNH
jgi:hypothetical protein